MKKETIDYILNDPGQPIHDFGKRVSLFMANGMQIVGELKFGPVDGTYTIRTQIKPERGPVTMVDATFEAEFVAMIQVMGEEKKIAVASPFDFAAYRDKPK